MTWDVSLACSFPSISYSGNRWNEYDNGPLPVRIDMENSESCPERVTKRVPPDVFVFVVEEG
jgi:hypothetical protein